MDSSHTPAVLEPGRAHWWSFAALHPHADELPLLWHRPPTPVYSVHTSESETGVNEDVTWEGNEGKPSREVLH